MPNLKFYWARLKKVSWPELGYRARSAIQTWRLRTWFHQGNPRLGKIPQVDSKVVKALQVPDTQWGVDEETIGRLLGGEAFTLYGDRRSIEQFEESYRGKFFADIPLYDSKIDIRQVWEPARLQNITILLLACLNNQGHGRIREFQSAAKKALLHWIGGNLFLSGPHYMSAMECGLRIPVFFLH